MSTREVGGWRFLLVLFGILAVCCGFFFLVDVARDSEKRACEGRGGVYTSAGGGKFLCLDKNALK